MPVSGFVRPAVAFTPDNLKFQKFSVPDGGTYLDVHVKQFTEEPMALVKVECDVEGFEVTSRDLESGRVWRIRAIATKDLPLGPFEGTITVHTDREKYKTLTIPIRGERVEAPATPEGAGG